MFQALISPIASLAGTWLEGKVSKAKAETEVKVAPELISKVPLLEPRDISVSYTHLTLPTTVSV